MNTDLANKLRDTISRNMLTGDKRNMVNEIRDLFDSTINRAKTIARTETARAYAVGNYTGAIEAKKRGYNIKKYWFAVLDDRTSPLCSRLSAKYDKDNAIDAEKEFIDPKGEWRGMTHPAHPNCFDGDTLITTNKGKKKIKDVCIGDLVLTHKSRYKEVYSTMNRVSEDYYKISVGSGKNIRELKVTGEHPVMTNTGWKKVKDLTTQDWVMSL
jgi:SPP1 gp7 family putative phage head morphogenesis protein